jgi:predicted Rossmann fold flavoprotein
MNIAIVGAGASGMAAALQAAWSGAEVTLFEHNPSVGRKLLVTGSGRCNITNEAVAAQKYACADPQWLDTLFRQFGVPELLSMLLEIGIPVHKTSDGWYYPLSESAQNVADAFSNALSITGIDVRTSTHVSSIRSQKGSLSVQVSSDQGEKRMSFDRVIVSAGGKAYPGLGSRGDLFPILSQSGHTVIPKRPALAPVLADLGKLHALQGVRMDVGTSLWEGSNRLGSAAGNLIFTQWGLNGPAVMDISHLISARPGSKLTLSLNLLEFFQKEFDDLLAKKRSSAMLLKTFLGAFLPPKTAQLYTQMVHLPDGVRMADIDDQKLRQLLQVLKDTRLPVKGVRDFEFCQVSAGGVPVSEVDPQSMASRRVQGLYLTGETLDVVGPCGGYNLQFAFSSGAVAGRSAANR